LLVIALLFLVPSPLLSCPLSRLRYVKTDDELAWTLPAGGIVLGKSYKIKWRIRLGRSVASGTELPLTVSVAEWMEDLVVSVK
jgi:hypothetical protein